jgi:hypothetical protein
LVFGEDLAAESAAKPVNLVMIHGVTTVISRERKKETCDSPLAASENLIGGMTTRHSNQQAAIMFLRSKPHFLPFPETSSS